MKWNLKIKKRKIKNINQQKLWEEVRNSEFSLTEKAGRRVFHRG